MSYGSRETPELTLVMGADRVPAKRFVAAAETFVSLVRNVTAETAGAESFELFVHVDSGSQVLGVTGDGRATPSVIEAGFGVVWDGLQVINGPNPNDVPTGFDDQALRQLRTLATLAPKGLGGVEVRRGSERVELTARTVHNIDRLRSGGYTLVGSIEGRLDAVNVHNELRCTLCRAIDNKAIRVEFDDELFDTIRAHLRSRVAATGTIFYDTAHRVKRLKVERLQRLRDETELPSVQEIAGILGG